MAGSVEAFGGVAREKESTSGRLKVVIDNGTYDLLNVGDVVMLQCAIRRLLQVLPGAEMHVFTTRPERLRLLCPAAVPVHAVDCGRPLFLEAWNVLGPLSHLVPRSYEHLAYALEQRLRLSLPVPALSWIGARQGRRGKDAWGAKRFLELIRSTDLVVASGGGYIADAFAPQATYLLRTFETAQSLGIPTALFGQGIGPLEKPELSRLAGRVLRRAGFIGLREPHGASLLRTLGIDEGRMRITGDEAIEEALRHRPPELGHALGFNMRMSSYSGLSEATAGWIRKVVTAAAERRAASICGVPISFYPEEADAKALPQSGEPDSTALVPPERGGFGAGTPAAVLETVSRCRVVVTGSYHGGVFALSQGVPIVGLVNSPYYAAKFRGLADQFPGGVTWVALDQPEAEAFLTKAIDDAWDGAEATRDQLLACAQAQAAIGMDCYRRIPELLRSKRATSPA